MASSPDPDISFNINNNENDRPSPLVQHSTTGHGDQRVHMPSYSVPSIPTRLPHVEPDHFSGTENFEQYMSHFEDCAELSAWSDRVKVLVLSSKLKGNARNFYMSLGEIERRSYPLLVERLSERFGGNKHQNLWLSKLENRRRGKCESVASLAYDLRHLAQMAYADLDRHAQEKLALNQLYKQIPVEMHCRCIDRGCSTIADAVNIIEQYEGVLGASPVHSSVRAVDDAHRSNTIEQQLSQIQARLDQIEHTARPVPQKKPYRSLPSANARLCFGCKSPDHFWRNCPNNVNSKQAHSDFNQRNGFNVRPQQQFYSAAAAKPQEN